eukprot:TRINITY_DN8307_c0_g1_i1.p1 TRINITY_DN8307_c0_g1~~TRINITY_DN8307_c0_g1_i1.p1  ORF type:complete len:1038 (+),score=181.01 TRINITY_DN8307_c0_g1_i1:30-3143(+)
MFSALLSAVLERYLGKYVDGFQRSENFSVSVAKGHAHLEYLTLRSEALKQLDLPLQVVHGSVDMLDIYIPWQALKTSSVQVHFQNVSMLVRPKRRDEHNDVEYQQELQRKKQSRLRRAERKGFDEVQEKASSAAPKEKDFFQRLLSLMLKNVEMRFTNCHFRYEASVHMPRTFACGWTISSIASFPTSDRWQKTFIPEEEPCSHRVFQLLNVTVYAHRNVIPIALLDHRERIREMERIVVAACTAPESKRKDAAEHASIGPSSETSFANVLKPLHLTVKKREHNLDIPTPKKQTMVFCGKVGVSIASWQVDEIKRLVDFMNKHKSITKYLKYRPRSAPCQSKQALRDWWIYAYTVVKFRRKERMNPTWQEMKKVIADRNRYADLYRRLFLAGPRDASLSPASVHKGAESTASKGSTSSSASSHPTLPSTAPSTAPPEALSEEDRTRMELNQLEFLYSAEQLIAFRTYARRLQKRLKHTLGVGELHAKSDSVFEWFWGSETVEITSEQMEQIKGEMKTLEKKESKRKRNSTVNNLLPDVNDEPEMDKHLSHAARGDGTRRVSEVWNANFPLVALSYADSSKELNVTAKDSELSLVVLSELLPLSRDALSDNTRGESSVTTRSDESANESQLSPEDPVKRVKAAVQVIHGSVRFSGREVLRYQVGSPVPLISTESIDDSKAIRCGADLERDSMLSAKVGVTVGNILLASPALNASIRLKSETKTMNLQSLSTIMDSLPNAFDTYIEGLNRSDKRYQSVKADFVIRPQQVSGLPDSSTGKSFFFEWSLPSKRLTTSAHVTGPRRGTSGYSHQEVGSVLWSSAQDRPIAFHCSMKYDAKERRLKSRSLKLVLKYMDKSKEHSVAKGELNLGSHGMHASTANVVSLTLKHSKTKASLACLFEVQPKWIEFNGHAVVQSDFTAEAAGVAARTRPTMEVMEALQHEEEESDDSAWSDLSDCASDTDYDDELLEDSVFDDTMSSEVLLSELRSTRFALLNSRKYAEQSRRDAELAEAIIERHNSELSALRQKNQSARGKQTTSGL